MQHLLKVNAASQSDNSTPSHESTPATTSALIITSPTDTNTSTSANGTYTTRYGRTVRIPSVDPNNPYKYY